MKELIARFSQQAWVHVTVAAVVMGSWAAYANLSHGWEEALSAGLLQASISGTITYFLKTALEAIGARIPGRHGLWLPPTIACSGSFAVLVTLHSLAGTPEIIATIALPFTVASSYGWIYNAALWRARAKAAVPVRRSR